MKAGLYLRTASHLKGCQLWGRLLLPFRLPFRGGGEPLPLRGVSGPWTLPAFREPSFLSPSRAAFLGEERDVGAPSAWSDAGASRLWLYNLHYFDDLNAGDPAGREWRDVLVRRWIDENPPPSRPGWEPYPLSLRIVNWIKRHLGGRPLPPEALRSLADQVRCLRGSVETHLLGNHLLANAKALVFAGSFFEGEEADRWLALGVALLSRELPEQILPDGGHFERSPMYHCLVLEDLLDLLNLSRSRSKLFGGGAPAAAAAAWEETATRMRRWLKVMCHPDGQIPLFNDAAFGIAPPPAELEEYALRLGGRRIDPPGEGLILLPDTGYARLARGAAAAFLDVAPVGPDYLPGHGHADTLSFELSLFGHRVVVDPGTSTYETGEERSIQRGTAAHNTVAVEGEDSSEVWGSFRVGRRAKPFDLRTSAADRSLVVTCSHDGYRRLPGKVVHRRRWTLGDGRLSVEDVLEGRYGSARQGVLLSPDVGVCGAEGAGAAGGRVALKSPGGESIAWSSAPGACRIEAGLYHPGFGIARETSRLVCPVRETPATFEFHW